MSGLAATARPGLDTVPLGDKVTAVIASLQSRLGHGPTLQDIAGEVRRRNHGRSVPTERLFETMRLLIEGGWVERVECEFKGVGCHVGYVLAQDSGKAA